MISASQKEEFRKIAYNLYSIRMSKNLTQESLSNESGVERSKISRIENYAEDFLFSTILNLAHALNVYPEKILDLNVIVPDNFEDEKKKIPKIKKL